MQPLVDAACNIITCREKLGQAEAALFALLYDCRAELYCKLREIAFHLCRGEQEPKTCGESNSILFAIKDFTDEEFDKLQYPASCIEWDIPSLNNTLEIEVSVEAFCKGERDAYWDIRFPIKEDEYSVFIKELNKKANDREDALKAKEAEENALAEEAEKKTLAALLQKYRI